MLWTFPILFFSSFTTIENLNNIAPGLVKVLSRNNPLYGVVSGLLPVVRKRKTPKLRNSDPAERVQLLTIIFMALVPVIIRFAVNRRKFYSLTLVDAAVMEKLFGFYYVNVLLAFLVGPVIVGTSSRFT